MADKMTIIGKDGKERFVVDENNRVQDLLHCQCKPGIVDSDSDSICRSCGKPILRQPIPSEEG